MKLKQSSPFIWFALVLIIFIVGFSYAILMVPLQKTYNQFYNDSDLDEQVYQTFYTRSKTIWYWFPLITIFALIFWALIQIHIKTMEEGYG